MKSSIGVVFSLAISIRAAAIVSFPNPPGYTTRTYNAHAPSSAAKSTDQYSNDALVSLWSRVGPIAPPKNTAVASPTPEPSSLSAFPQPDPAFHPLVASHETGLKDVKLPQNFAWGVASSAYQIEGAAKEDGKGPSIWDMLSHQVPGFVADNSTGDVLAEHYYLFKQDIARLKALGFKAFSPSISWPRIFPFGNGPVNAPGVAHYDAVITALVDVGISPAVTLFHWDTPLALFHEYGGWSNEKIVDDFVHYAKFIITRYDKYVPIWFTINEPQYCNWQYAGYPAEILNPKTGKKGEKGGIKARFACGHYTLLAHARVAKWYHEEFKGQGRITFKNSGNYYEPASTAAADLRSAQRNYDFSIGWFSGPWTDGDYPESLKSTLDDVLPKYTEEEKRIIKGSCDFYAIDAYTSYTAFGSSNDEACMKDPKNGAFPECAGSRQAGNDGFPMGPAGDTGVDWMKTTPGGIRRYLRKLKEMWPSIPDIVVTEFGFAEPFENLMKTKGEILWDLRRADYYQGFLDNILASIHYDKVNVTGAWGWAIFDNFEWNAGLSTRFGLQYVNYTDLTRTPKASMFQFLNWFQ
ncbi:glycoside hydrolase [Microthyrium microscopicum]|uniref:Glycoside hydrolase n=1 Tax=Microthyrium microscopicum TaxID=703497 RepID=A0A6A6UPD0_9PEZI|nr:glycoside hydrolase [Microthyrium microscopicum]